MIKAKILQLFKSKIQRKPSVPLSLVLENAITARAVYAGGKLKLQ